MRGALYRLSDRAVVGRSGRFCPSDSRFKASRVTGYTTDPMWPPGKESNLQVFGVEVRCLIQFGHQGRLEPPGRFELPISWLEARCLSPVWLWGHVGRFEWVRTTDFTVIGRVLYLAELRSVGVSGQNRTPLISGCNRALYAIQPHSQCWRLRPVSNWLPLT